MYIHQTAYISAQETTGTVNLDTVRLSEHNMLKAIEPASYEGIPLNVLRRMGRAVKIGVGVALPLIKQSPRIDGIITGSANGGMEDCFRFLQQTLEYHEGTLTPTGFVQSTANAIASQVGLLTGNNGYNSTHVHRGQAFENAMLDAIMLLHERPEAVLLLMGVEEISQYNHNLLYSDGWYKTAPLLNTRLYDYDTPGTIAGEGAAGFIVSNQKQGAVARLVGVKMMATADEKEVAAALHEFVQQHAGGFKEIDVLLSGENGDNREARFYNECYSLMAPGAAIARFKHFTGEYATVGSGALWLACRFLSAQNIPVHFLKKEAVKKEFRQVLVYNNFNGYQHSFFLLKTG